MSRPLKNFIITPVQIAIYPCANAFYNKYAPARYYARRAFPDVKALEELFVETTLALLPCLPVRLAKTHLAHWYTQKTKCSLTTAVYTPSACTEDHHCHSSQATINIIVQLGISYQILQDIRCAASTDADFGKALADSSTKPISSRGPDPSLRSRASALMPHFLLYFYIILRCQPVF